MSVGLVSNGHDIPDEEARAEVDVLNSRLEKTTQLTKKIQSCLGRLDTTGKSVHDVAGPLNGETRRLQTLGHSRSHYPHSQHLQLTLDRYRCFACRYRSSTPTRR